MRYGIVAWVCAGLLVSCTTAKLATNLSPASVKKPSGSWERFAADPRIGRYVSSGWGFSTVSYWIEGPQGVVVIDTQFLPSAARELLHAAEQTTGKSVVAAVVLHPNPDKFNGTAVFQERKIPVLTSQQILGKIPEVHHKRLAVFGERYAPDYPVVAPQPQAFTDKTTAIEWAGLSFQAHVLGPGCSAAHLVIEFDKHIFVGDLIATNTHSWLELGQIAEWQVRLRELEALDAQFVHPGRGASGGPERIAEQRDYLKKVIDIVVSEKTRLFAEHPQPTASQSQEAIQRAKTQIMAVYPNFKFKAFLDIGIPSVWQQANRG